MDDEEKKTVTIEDVGGEFGFRLRWDVNHYCADVSAFEIVARVEGNPQFNRKGATSWPDNVDEIGDAQPYLSGFVKWDGCSDFDFFETHFCGPRDYKTHCSLLRYIYERAHELMGREPEESW